MDLTIKEVSELLNVSEDIILKWVLDGKIPNYKLNDDYRFNPDEIEDWMINVNDESIKKALNKMSLNDKKVKEMIGMKIGTQAFSLFRAIHKGGVIFDVEGESKEDIIIRSVEIIAKNLNLDAGVLTELLLQRERVMPTSLNHGIAAPHTRDFISPKPFDIISVVYPKKSMDYGALDGKKVHTLFFLFAGDDKKHLHLLSKLSYFTKSEEASLFLSSKPNKKDLLNYIKDWETKLNKKTILK